jgi:hypothetical protein
VRPTVSDSAATRRARTLDQKTGPVKCFGSGRRLREQSQSGRVGQVASGKKNPPAVRILIASPLLTSRAATRARRLALSDRTNFNLSVILRQIGVSAAGYYHLSDSVVLGVDYFRYRARCDATAPKPIKNRQRRVVWNSWLSLIDPEGHEQLRRAWIVSGPRLAPIPFTG